MPLIVLILLILFCLGGFGYPYLLGTGVHHAGFQPNFLFVLILVVILVWYFGGPYRNRL